MATSLAELDLQGNALTELPLEIAFCRRLKLLDVSNNELRDIAFTLGEQRRRGGGHLGVVC